MWSRGAESEQGERCREEARATEYVRGELRHGELDRFEEHLVSCASCREAVMELRETVSLLEGAVPLPAEDIDVTDRVLARIDQRNRERESRRRIALARGAAGSLAAALAVVALLIWAARGTLPDAGELELATVDSRAAVTDAARAVSRSERSPPGLETALDHARDWLLSVQEPDGSWEPSRWGGSDEFRIALTGLATLALAGDERPPARDATARATRFLVSSQSSEGHFGERTRGSLFNHALATLAVTELAGASASLREPARRAARYLVESQTAAGAWGYVSREGTIANDSISVWALEALVRAREIEPAIDRRAIEKGFEWFESLVRRETAPTYLGHGGHVCGEGRAPLVALAALSPGAGADTRTARVARDRLLRQGGVAELCFYDSYFLARSSLADDHPALGEFRLRLRRALQGSQVRTGALSGSWEPEDRWSPVGGRLYTTALAALALQPPGAPARG